MRLTRWVLTICLLSVTTGCIPRSRITYIELTSQDLRAIELANASSDFQAYLKAHPSHSDYDVIYGVESDQDEANPVDADVDDGADVPVAYCQNEYHVDIENVNVHVLGADKATDASGIDKEIDEGNPTLLVDVATGLVRREYLSDTPAPSPTPCLDGSAPAVSTDQ